MFEISFATGMVTTVLGWCLFRMCAFLKNRKWDWKYEAKQLLFLVNLAVIIRFTFYPFSKADGQVQPLLFEVAAAFPFRVNLVPFVNLLDYTSKTDLIINIIGNFAMFIPTGIMLPLIYKSRDSLKKTMLTGAAISLIIEVLQLPFAVRASDIDDFILNTAGCLVGYGILNLFRIKKKKANRSA